MTGPERVDDLKQRYLEASAQDERRPTDRVREAARAHAQMLLAGNRRDQLNAQGVAPQASAANQSGWKLSMFASFLVIGLAGLLVVQFDQGTPQEKELAHGVPVPGVASAPPAKLPPPAHESALKKDDPADAGPASIAAPETRPVKAVPEVRARERAAREPSAAKLAAPEPFPAARPADARAQAAPRQDAAAPGPAPAPAPTPTGAAAPALSPAPGVPAQTEATSSNRTANLADLPVRKDSAEAQSQSQAQAQSKSQAPRLGALARSAQAAASPLHDAARFGRLGELERLIAAGAQLNAPDAAGKTPLMLAAINGHGDAVRRLLAAGANRSLVDHEGLTALQLARRLGLDSIAGMIEP